MQTVFFKFQSGSCSFDQAEAAKKGDDCKLFKCISLKTQCHAASRVISSIINPVVLFKNAKFKACLQIMFECASMM